MINDISRKNLVTKEWRAYTYYINFFEVIIRQQKLRVSYRELPTIALWHHVNIRKNY